MTRPIFESENINDPGLFKKKRKHDPEGIAKIKNKSKGPKSTNFIMKLSIKI